MAARKAKAAARTAGTARKAARKAVGRSQAKRAAPAKRAAKKVTSEAQARTLAYEGSNEQKAAQSLRTYRARQAVIGPNGRVRAGEYVQLDPESGLARSLLVVLVEDPPAPAAVAKALGDAG